ncbi:unnamed protein product [Discosporangium mesarthrocarpum]
MSKYACEFDNDFDRDTMPDTPPGDIVSSRRGKKRAREFTKLKDNIEKASAKELQSWNTLRNAVAGQAMDGEEGKFSAVGSTTALDHMRAKTVGLVSAEDFRKAREESEALIEAEKVKRQVEAESRRKKEEKRQRKKRDKEERLRKSTMSFELDEWEVEDVKTTKSDASPEVGPPTGPGARIDGRSVKGNKLDSSNHAGGGSEDGKGMNPTPPTRSLCTTGRQAGQDEGGARCSNEDGCPRVSRDLQGAAPDTDNLQAAGKLRERLLRHRSPQSSTHPTTSRQVMGP